MAAQIMDFYIVPGGGSTDQELHGHFQLQLGSWTSTWSPVAAQVTSTWPGLQRALTIDTNIVTRVSTDQASWTTDIFRGVLIQKMNHF